MVILAFYAGTVIGVLIGMFLMALLHMSKGVEDQEAESLTNIDAPVKDRRPFLT